MTVKMPKEDHQFARIDDVMVPMRDGTELKTSLYFPMKDGKVDLTRKYSAILTRTPYAYILPISNGMWPIAMDGYTTSCDCVYVVNKVRGTDGSGGAFEPMKNEGWGANQDGIDTIKWIAQQTWSNGNVSTCGISYMGHTQVKARLADPENPSYCTATVLNPVMDEIDNMPYEDDFFFANLSIPWSFDMVTDMLGNNKYSEETEKAILEDNQILNDPLSDPEVRNTEEYIKKYGLRNIPVIRHANWYKEWIENYDNKDYFMTDRTQDRPHNVDKPVLVGASWYDIFLRNSLGFYERLVNDAPNEKVRKGHRLVIGPWAHVVHPDAIKAKNGWTDQASMACEWSLSQMGGPESEFFEKTPVSLYMLGEEKWRREQEWPLQDAVYTKYYLHSKGNANSADGDGSLSIEQPGDEKADTYVSDPKNPVHHKLEHDELGGMCDHSDNEKRKDVLVYSTPVLERDTEVTGYINAVLYAASDAEDSDFIIKLMDVYPDGTVINRMTSGKRGRYRKSRWAPEPLIPGEIVRYEMKMRPVGCVFKKGHRIRVEVMSSNSPIYDINPQQFVDLRTCTEKDYVIAKQSIYHDIEHASYIELPIIPDSHKRDWIDEWPFHPDKTEGLDGFEAQNIFEELTHPLIVDKQILE